MKQDKRLECEKSKFERLKECYKEKDVISKIPNSEYENLSLKCFNITKKLWIDRTFTNDGDFEERKNKYEEKSNPLSKFIKENYVKDVNSEVLFNDFFDSFIIYLEERGARILSAIAVSKQLKNEGYEIKTITKNDKTAKFILGLNNPNNPNNPISYSDLHVKNSEKKDYLGNMSYSQREIPELSLIHI